MLVFLNVRRTQSTPFFKSECKGMIFSFKNKRSFYTKNQLFHRPGSDFKKTDQDLGDPANRQKNNGL